MLCKIPGHRRGREGILGRLGNTRAMLDNYARHGFDVFAGSEVFLLDNMRNGGKGCITATGNVNPGPIDHVFRNWRSADADKLQAGISATRKIVQKQPMIPALKAIVAHFGNDPQWKTCRPPLIELSSSQEESLRTDAQGQPAFLHAWSWRENGAGYRCGERNAPIGCPKLFAKSGFKVIALDKEKIKGGVTYDLTDLAGIPQLVASLGEIDVLVNNAGVQNAVSIENYSEEQRKRILRVNLEAPVELIRAVSKQMVGRRSGRTSARLGLRVHSSHRLCTRTSRVGSCPQLRGCLARRSRSTRWPPARSTRRSSTAPSPSAWRS